MKAHEQARSVNVSQICIVYSYDAKGPEGRMNAHEQERSVPTLVQDVFIQGSPVPREREQPFDHMITFSPLLL